MSSPADVPISRPASDRTARLRRAPILRAFPARVPLVPRIVIASALLAVLVAGAFAILVIALSELRETTTEAGRSKDVTASALLLEQHLLQADAALRGYVNTGDPRFLRIWRKARSELPGSTAALVDSASGDPAQLRRVGRLVAAVRAYEEDYAVPLVGIAEVSPAAARSAVALAEGRRRLDSVRARFADVLTVENTVSASRVSSATSQAHRAIVIGVVALGASVFLVLLFGVELARAVARPVRQASEAAKGVAAGDLSVRLPQGGPAEVYDLSVAFNEMAESLERSKHELVAQNQQLLESERLRAELISVISHEVRTPLACVLGYTSLLQTRPTDEETRQRFLGIINDEARRLEALVDELVDVKRIEEGRLDLVAATFDIAALVEEQARSFDGRSDQHTIRVSLADDPLLVHADGGRLTQVLANLLANAVKYSPQGGELDVIGERRGDTVRISVRDPGIGISSDDRPRIFSKFFRGTAGSQGIGGMGLGLAVSREIVEAHGGRMGFESESGQGSTFWFELPTTS